MPSRVPRPAVSAYTIDEPPHDGRLLRLGNADRQVLRTPGHTPGHLPLWQPEERLLVTGDALSDYDVGWVNLALDGPQAAATALASLRRLADLVPRVLLPAHGPIPADPGRSLRHLGSCPASGRRPGRGGVVRRPADLRLRPDDPRRDSRRPGRALPARPRLGDRRGPAPEQDPEALAAELVDTML